MTRGKFEKLAMEYAKAKGNSVIQGNETLDHWLRGYSANLQTSDNPTTVSFGRLLEAIAGVAINGLEPESLVPHDYIHSSPADIKRAVEHLVGVAEKQDRRVHVTSGKLSVGPPFIGSHNLPHDTDWD